jgi:hypothetical protein
LLITSGLVLASSGHSNDSISYKFNGIASTL